MKWMKKGLMILAFIPLLSWSQQQSHNTKVRGSTYNFQFFSNGESEGSEIEDEVAESLNNKMEKKKKDETTKMAEIQEKVKEEETQFVTKRWGLIGGIWSVYSRHNFQHEEVGSRDSLSYKGFAAGLKLYTTERLALTPQVIMGKRTETRTTDGSDPYARASSDDANFIGAKIGLDYDFLMGEGLSLVTSISGAQLKGQEREASGGNTEKRDFTTTMATFGLGPKIFNHALALTVQGTANYVIDRFGSAEQKTLAFGGNANLSLEF